jgi:hypothetical protein
MLLKRLTAARRGEDGSALATVIGVFGVLSIASLAIAGAAVHGLAQTSSTRASVQAEAAAESGIDYARAQLAAGSCAAAGYSQTTPAHFTVAVSYSTTSAGTSWTPGCPSASARLVRTIATGYATSHGVAGASSGDVRYVEAQYPAVVPQAITASGAAIYAYSSNSFGGSGSLSAPTGTVPTVEIKTGDVNCAGGSAVHGNIIAANGNLTLAGSCSVTGSAWSSGTLTASGGVTIGGNAVAANVNSTIHISGSVWATNTATLGWSGPVDQNATAATLNLAGGTVAGSAWATGAASCASGDTMTGHLTARSTSSCTASNFTKGASAIKIVPAGPGAGPAAPAMPTVPGWIEFGYNPSAWTGFTIVTIASCDYSTVNNAIASLGTRPGIINAMACPSGFTADSYRSFALNSDVAIFARSFDLNGGSGSGGFTAASPHRLWLVAPDANLTDGAPTCPSGSSFTIGGGFTLSSSATSSNIHAMIYTPCLVKLASGVHWFGQIFAGSADIDGGANIAYAPLGLPGYNLDTGSSTASASPSLIGGQTVIRDRTDAGS